MLRVQCNIFHGSHSSSSKGSSNTVDVPDDGKSISWSQVKQRVGGSVRSVLLQYDQCAEQRSLVAETEGLLLAVKKIQRAPVHLTVDNLNRFVFTL